MLLLRFILLIVFWAPVATWASAEVRNPNPNAVLSIVGNPNPWILFRTPGQVLEEGFAIKLVSPSGEPLRGLEVDFTVNHPVQTLQPPGTPPSPPAALYGQFAGPHGWALAYTDDEGIARSGPFKGGNLSGSYSVSVSVLVNFYPANRILVSPPGPGAWFRVTQVLDAPQAIIDLSSGPPVGPTQRCNTGASSEIVLSGMSSGSMWRLQESVYRPALDPSLYSRLWAPNQARFQNNSQVILSMDPLQDIPEMVASIRADPLIAALGVSSVQDNGGICLAAFLPPTFQRVTEYYNTTLKHYFLSSSTEENASIDSGGAGPGWVKTGESFQTIPPNNCDKSDRVFRFYGPGPNSHFYTADPNECGGLRTQKSGWKAEGVAFGAKLPQNGLCPSALYTPVYRLYNNRWMFNDSNHRYTIKTDVYQQMISQGWVGEGVALCVRDGK